MIYLGWPLQSRQGILGFHPARGVLVSDRLPCSSAAPTHAFPAHPKTIASSVGALLFQHRPEGADDHLDIEPERPIFRIVFIEEHPLLIVDVVTAGDLPETGYPRRNLEEVSRLVSLPLTLLGQDRPAAHQAHVSLQDFPEVRDLVEAGLV